MGNRKQQLAAWRQSKTKKTRAEMVGRRTFQELTDFYPRLMYLPYTDSWSLHWRAAQNKHEKIMYNRPANSGARNTVFLVDRVVETAPFC